MNNLSGLWDNSWPSFRLWCRHHSIQITLEQQSMSMFRRSFYSSLNHYYVISFCCVVFMNYGTLFSNPTNVTHTIPLYITIFLTAPITSPPLYPTLFFRYISSKIRMISFEIFPLSFKSWADAKLSIVSDVLLCRKDADSNLNYVFRSLCYTQRRTYI